MRWKTYLATVSLPQNWGHVSEEKVGWVKQTLLLISMLVRKVYRVTKD